ncbi:MAG TPA: DUF3857 domain-containing protein [Thermoanaerobaculia bacterium]|nr:DUF3857 domain-containing protein [Thermoanaerobaculia bacterium]
MTTRLFAAVALALFPAALIAADDLAFKTATPAELAMKDVDIAPGASAVVLDWFQRTDDTNQRSSEYVRIKVLKDEGKKYGDISIRHVPLRTNIEKIRARVTKPDGVVVPFNGKVYDKVVVKAGGVRVVEKTFTLPDVQPGAILEYSYEEGFRNNVFFDTSFKVQRELPVLHETLYLRPYTMGGYSTFFIYKGLPPGVKPVKNGDHFDLQLENIPAYEEEPFSPPEAFVKPTVIFYYAPGATPNVEEVWKTVAKSYAESIEDFLNEHGGVREAAQAAVAGANTPEEKLRKLYARAQQIRNLTFEPEKTAQEERELRENKSAIDVLRNNYGWRDEINRFFVTLARSAGFEANVVRIGDRSEWFLSKKLPLRTQLNNEVALVKLDGKDLLLDPATPFAPFGMLSWEKTNVSGIKVLKKSDSPQWIEIAQDHPEKAQLKRVAKLHLDGETLKGNVVVTYTGHRAMGVRREQRNHDEATAKKNIEDDVKSWFFNGSSAKLTKLTGLRDAEAPLVAELDVELPTTGAVTGSRALVPMAVFTTAAKSPLPSERRKSDLYFHYQYETDDDVTLDIPAGYAVEALPSPRNNDLGGLTYSAKYEQTPASVHLARSVAVKAIAIEVAKYNVARDFFKQVAAADQDQVVLKKAAK